MMQFQVEAIQQRRGRRRQKYILAEESNGNCRREEYNDGTDHEEASIKRGPKTAWKSNQYGLGQTVFRRRFQSYIS
jgi:hypothetical protein